MNWASQIKLEWGRLEKAWRLTLSAATLLNFCRPLLALTQWASTICVTLPNNTSTVPPGYSICLKIQSQKILTKTKHSRTDGTDVVLLHNPYKKSMRNIITNVLFSLIKFHCTFISKRKGVKERNTTESKNNAFAGAPGRGLLSNLHRLRK